MFCKIEIAKSGSRKNTKNRCFVGKKQQKNSKKAAVIKGSNKYAKGGQFAFLRIFFAFLHFFLYICGKLNNLYL